MRNKKGKKKNNLKKTTIIILKKKRIKERKKETKASKIYEDEWREEKGEREETVSKESARKN